MMVKGGLSPLSSSLILLSKKGGITMDEIKETIDTMNSAMEQMAQVEQAVSSLQYEVERMTSNEEAINALASDVNDNAYNIEQIDNEMENVSNSIQALPIREIVNAITELQQAVADLMKEPVGIVFDRIKVK